MNVTVWSVATGLVPIRKLPELEPAGIVIEPLPAATAGSELDKVTVIPPAGAGVFRVTVPVG